ncbi:hypothetical protein Q31b_31410 [Novipirellula aureliae]|uniref:Uncharacterized protein n=1 Tax=Novipirellula aureliae TaxID=2527966 RepID=A0A5C6DXQ1_9BACT|nr:hypothetical protein [Novipirellula aureliae]TWU39826.1 hypothetical protein Q31b_31410 [Novipirellula aureliae]
MLLKATIAGDVAGLFFPQPAELGLRVEATVSPRVERKMVYAGGNSTSFQQARKDLQNLADLEIKTERVRRATTRNGRDRLALMRLLEQAFLDKPIPEQLRGGPADQEVPPIAVVMCDGGRYQRFDRGEAKPDSGSFWRESRIACLLSMTAASYGNDPQSALPDFLKDVSIAKKLAEIGQVPGDNSILPKEANREQELPWERGEMLSKEIVASSRNWKEFGSQVASQAWYRGFGKATHKVFVSDGSSAIEELQTSWFSDYTSVLDIMHALSYSLAAARAIHSDRESAWQCYQQFATWIWRGEVDRVIASLAEHQQELGVPPSGASESDPKEIVRRSHVYYSNHRGRMNYPLYRRNGYPLTSSIMESTVKQVSRRVKGTEKFWSSEGGEAVLQLRGDYLSDSEPMNAHWQQAIANTDGFRAYRVSA